MNDKWLHRIRPTPDSELWRFYDAGPKAYFTGVRDLEVLAMWSVRHTAQPNYITLHASRLDEDTR